MLVYSFSTYVSRDPGGVYYVQGVTDTDTDIFTLRITPVNSGVPIDAIMVDVTGQVTIPSLPPPPPPLITLTGNVTGSGTGSIATTIAAGAVTNTMLAGSIAYAKLALTGAILNADLAGSIAYSKLVLTGAILNADLAGSIAYSKLSLTGAILNADLAGSIAYSKLALTGAILNADLAGSIAASKLVGTDIATVGTLTAGATGTGFTVALSTSTVTGLLALARGGLGFDASAMAKGGIVSGTGAGTAGLTAVGADGTVLTADAASAGGVKWTVAAGTGTVTTVSVVTANGISGTVANATTTPAITLALAAITPTTIAGSDATDATTPTTGAFKTAGGLGVAKALWVGGLANIAGVLTLQAQPIISTLTASLPVFTDGSKGLVSIAMTGTGNVVMSASPTLSGTVAGSYTMGGTGVWNAGAVTSSGTVAGVAGNFSGLLTVSGAGQHTFGSSANSYNILAISNPSNGAAAEAYLRVLNDVATFGMELDSSGHASSGLRGPNIASLIMDGAGGITIGAIHSSGAIRFYDSGSALSGQFASRTFQAYQQNNFSWQGGKTVGTVYGPANTDGFVIAYGAGNGTPGLLLQLAGYSDASNPPTTLRNIVSDLYSVANAGLGGLMFPVRKGDYYTVTPTGTFLSLTMWWIPNGTNP